jgi:2-succinyl-6-hydroxy-2,4-cyclohexadiene-1-carboxylate synthase
VSSPREQFVDPEGVRLRVCRWSAARPETPALVLHGFTGCIESMEDVIEALAVDRPVVAVDLVGHGRSDAPADPAHYSMDACIAQVAAALDVLRVRTPVHALGYSMGGRVALSLAVAQPEAVASLVLVGASPGLAEPAERAARVAADRALARQIEDQGLESFVDAWMSQPLFASQGLLGAGFLERARAQRMRCDPKGLANSLRGMGTGAMPPLHERLHALDRPVCLVAGAHDAKFVELAESMSQRLPDARCDRVEGVGHAAHLENGPAFVHTVRRFLSEVDAKQEIRS